MFHHIRRDDGGVAVTVAIVFIVLVLFAALAVDVGYLLTVRRQLQTAADAAALAGCRILADGGSDADVLAEAEVFANNNSTEPADGLVMLTDPPDTQVTEKWVQVTVTKDAPLFFARVLGLQTSNVVARSRAQIAYLTGMRGIVPWSVPVIHASRVSARVAGGAEVWLDAQGGGVWSGTIFAPSTSALNGYNVDVTAYNEQTAYPDGTSDYPNGVPEALPGATTIFVPPTDCPVLDVYLDRYVVTAGSTGVVRLYVRAAEQPTATFARKTIKLTAVTEQPGVWSAALTVPAVDDLWATFPIDVEVAKTTVTNAATLLVRRSTYPVSDVALANYVASPGQAITISVQLNDYSYGQSYELKVVGGAGEIGNFCAMDLSTIHHTPLWRNPQDPPEYNLGDDPGYKPPVYYHYLAEPFPFVVHIGDTIWTEPGSLSGPSTESALNDRFAGDSLTFSQWEAQGRPATTRVVYVPVVEKMQLVTGQTPMRVVSLAAFFIEPDSDIKKDAIIGRFVEYVSPSDAVSDTPPDGLYVLTVRLVAPE
ncbi:MAG: pilus assembly protein TadG-related protein [Actinomycetia bacterium]|nr:pilus assembly protein TadG-related protein [Actinomycetes bacterium]